jgi:hypothetical protein
MSVYSGNPKLFLISKLIGEINICTEDLINLPITSSPEEKAGSGAFLGTIEVILIHIKNFGFY